MGVIQSMGKNHVIPPEESRDPERAESRYTWKGSRDPFLDCVYAGTDKKNGEKGASLAKLHIDKGGGKHSYVGAVVDNTSSMVNMMSRLTTMYPWLATCGWASKKR